MPYTTFQAAGDPYIVGACPAGRDQLAFAVEAEDAHPFDLRPALLDRGTVTDLRDYLSAWLDRGRGECPPC